MPLLIVQLAVLVAIAFVIGCVLGRFMRRRSASMPDHERTIIAAAHATLPVAEKPEASSKISSPAKTEEPKISSQPREPEKLQLKAVPDAEVVGTGLLGRERRRLRQMPSLYAIRADLSFWKLRALESLMTLPSSKALVGRFRDCSTGSACFITTRLPAGMKTNRAGSSET